MKKAISLILAFVLCLSLCACGKSEAVKNVEAMIDAIGEVTAESNDTIVAAESAYNALTEEEKGQVSGISTLSAAKIDYVEILIDSIGEVSVESETSILAAEDAYNALSEEEKTAVENYDTLIASRISLDEALFEKLRLSFVGEWVMLSDSSIPYVTLNSDGSAYIVEYQGKWSLASDGETVCLEAAGGIFNFSISNIGNYRSISHAELGTLVKFEEYQEIANEYLTIVEITSENYGEYIGDAIYVRNALDVWGEPSNSNIFAFQSNAYANGLIFVGASEDFMMETSHGGLLENPFYSIEVPENDAAQISIQRIKGSVTYIDVKWVSDVTYDSTTSTRVITLIDGGIIYDRCMMGYAIGEEYSAYDYLSESNLTF